MTDLNQEIENRKETVKISIDEVTRCPIVDLDHSSQLLQILSEADIILEGLGLYALIAQDTCEPTIPCINEYIKILGKNRSNVSRIRSVVYLCSNQMDFGWIRRNHPIVNRGLGENVICKYSDILQIIETCRMVSSLFLAGAPDGHITDTMVNLVGLSERINMFFWDIVGSLGIQCGDHLTSDLFEKEREDDNGGK